MVYRIFVEKKDIADHEVSSLYRELTELLEIKGIEKVRLLNRYDAEGISRDLFDYAVKTVFSEPQIDNVCEAPDVTNATVFAVEYLPGQFDMRADSAAQCIRLISPSAAPMIRSAKVYLIYGNISAEELEHIKKYVINPVEAREAALDLPQTLQTEYKVPTEVETLTGFRAMDRAATEAFVAKYGLAMDSDDLQFCRDYFVTEGRDPTITEIRMLDTYWSDHCRHTTFLTHLENVTFADTMTENAWQDYLQTRRELGRTKPVCLMDVATLAVKYLKQNGKLDKLDESEEINACTVKINVTIDGKEEPWLLLFKNETHNHPTEIEPFGGAATCIGGAIRDPLSGRSYVYGAMRVTGAADPTVPLQETLPGKLPQRKLVTTAAAGYSSYGNQIGLATGIVDELYHPGYAAKRMEIGAVIAAAPAKNVRRERPVPGDVVILLGGATGRDGIGGATGSSKAHDTHSVEKCGAEVQKGNAPEERKLQRLFRNPQASAMIKRCNDFGAGGVSVAIGELADGLRIDLNAVPKKYEGLDGTELAISESQERMAVVVAPEDLPEFLRLADMENLSAVKVAVVTEDPRLVMEWNGKKIVDISRSFIDSNGAPKKQDVSVSAPADFGGTDYVKDAEHPELAFKNNYLRLAAGLKCCSRRGLSERFDSTIGAGTVLMPFGGKKQRSPIQAMVQKISLEKGHTDDCSFMSWGFNPAVSEKSPFHGAYYAVVESVSKLIATGAAFNDVYLTFQEYFEKPMHEPTRWGKPLAALLGAFEAQKNLGIGAIGGKDSMSGSFEKLDVPPTLVSFAVTTGKTDEVVSTDFKAAGHKLLYIKPNYDENGLPETESLLAVFDRVTKLRTAGKLYAAATLTSGGIAEALMKGCFGNGLGVCLKDSQTPASLFDICYGSFILETDVNAVEGNYTESELGILTDEPAIAYENAGASVTIAELAKAYEGKLESVYPCNTANIEKTPENYSFIAERYPAPRVRCAKPRVLIPVFPGTNCEYDSARAVAEAGAEPIISVINTRTEEGIRRSVEAIADEIAKSQIIFLPGGFSGGDEPDGSGKFITAFFRNEAVKAGVTDLLDNRDGLMCGICNGFQALIKLGLVPYGKIIDTDADCATLTFNAIGRHQSKIVRTRIASNKSPWLALTNPGEVYSVPISHGEGRFVADAELIAALAANGQIATQYVDDNDNASMEIQFNPNCSFCAIEGITSPDGRVFGKMGHSERVGNGLYQNVPGNYFNKMFDAAVQYYK